MKKRYTFLVVLFLISLIPVSLAMWHVIDPYSARTFQVSVFPTRGAILSLGELGDPRASETLTRILLDTAAEVPVRAAAAEALGELGDPAAAEALEEVIEDRTNDEAVREAAVEALLAIEPDSEFGRSLARMLAISGAVSGSYEPDVSDRLMVKGLLDVVANGYHEECDSLPELDWDPEFDWELRLSAATALGKMGDPRAVERLLTILTDGGPSAKAAAAIALGGMKEPRAVKHFEAILAAPARGNAETDPVCDEAATALVRIEGSGAVEVLLQTLREGSLPAKAAAVSALATLDDPRAADALLTIVSDRSKASAAVFRNRAAVALGKMEADEAVGPLVAMLKSADASARAAAAIGLGYLGDRLAIGPLLEALTNPNVAWKDRETAAHVLDTLHAVPESGPGRAWYLVAMNRFDKLGDLGTDAVEPLVTALRETDRGTIARCEAVEALRKIGGDRAVTVLAVEPLIALLHDKTAAADLRHIAAVALGDLGEPRAIEPLIAVLTDPGSDEGVRAGAAEALGKCGDARAVEPLIAALGDARLHLDARLRCCAVESLGEIGDPRAVEPLIATLKDKDELVAGRAATALEKLGDRRAIEPLIAVFKDRADFTARGPVALALGKFKDPRIVEALIPILSYFEGRRDISLYTEPLVIALANQDDPRAVYALIRALYGPGTDKAKIAAAAGLARLGDPSAVEPLTVVAGRASDTAEVREAAGEALEELKAKMDKQSQRSDSKAGAAAAKESRE